MVLSALRFLAVMMLALTLCDQGWVVSSLLAGNTPAESCCPTEPDERSEETGPCGTAECQCLSCLNIVLTNERLPLMERAGVAAGYHDSISPLTGGNYRTIDYPPEIA